MLLISLVFCFRRDGPKDDPEKARRRLEKKKVEAANTGPSSANRTTEEAPVSRAAEKAPAKVVSNPRVSRQLLGLPLKLPRPRPLPLL